eukprot:TRINITY_DN8644_c0_g1_i1.p1 TRINITY_DN8644_c0_g1~~TRINITY_DN8644_c0_g1_i1.p1  ORF type:complete len:754 (-),score=182.83 TRINITY_DN8644_c0_g1_i1:121-2382(-)
MDQLIPVINKLQDVFNAIGTEEIDLPQIVVVGSQSSGKSSVLENIVGRDFLPRGSGIVTRRPLVLQLIHLPFDSKQDEKFSEWGEFLHKPNEMFYDFNLIREEISKETDRVTGKNKGISNVPINLKIYSRNVVNLTLVDLPGITRVPIEGQPLDIEFQIRKMIQQYIEKPNAIILAVTAANSDLSNSDALQVAREYDPDGQRTIGVITKIDIMDKGTDAYDMLTGKIIPLKLGFIGVVNRSQQDINTRKPIKQALKEEAEYFSSHPIYRSIASRCGTPFLAKTLNRILMNHIRECLPELKKKLSKKIQETSAELASYGDPLYDSPNSKGALLLSIITKFSGDYKDAIDGKSTDLSLNELYGGARINYIFNEIFASCLNLINPLTDLTSNEIRTAIRNATGPKSALFVPESSFELLVKKQIGRLDEPCLQCVELVFDELQRIVSQLESKELLRFQVLRERVVEVVNTLLHKCRSPTKAMITNLIMVELAYINTNHPDFVGGGGAINGILEKMAQQAAAERESQQSTWGPTAQNLTQSISQPQQPQQPQPQVAAPQPAQPKTAAMGQANLANATGQNNFFNKFFGENPNQPAQRGGSIIQQTQIPPQAQQKQAQPQPQHLQTAQTQQKTKATTVASSRSDRLEQVPVTIKAITAPNDKEQFEIELIQRLLISYFDLVRKNIKDLVPKSIMHFLVNSSKENIHNELVASLYREELIDDLLSENPSVAARRKECKQVLDVLRKANEILNEVRDFAVK